MIQPIMKDEFFLAQKSVPAVNCEEELGDADHIGSHAHTAFLVGLQRLQKVVGYLNIFIAFDNEGSYMVMFNPEIVKSSDRYEAEEGCLSLTGTRKTKRWKSIKVQYQNEQFQTRFKTFTGWTAQIIQHEIDHCNGIII